MNLAFAGHALVLPKKGADRVHQSTVRFPISCNANPGRSALIRGIDEVSRIIARLTKNPTSSSPYAKGMYAPQPNEYLELNAKITGEIPHDMSGMFVSIGPNPQYPAIGGYHPFEGDGSVSCVRIRKDGTASFSYSHLETEKRIYERSIGRSTVVSMMSMQGISGVLLISLALLRRKLTGEMFSASTANTNVEEHGGRVFALMETRLPYELKLSDNGASLQCKGVFQCGEYNGTFSAHPVAHPSNGCLYSVSYNWEGENFDATVVVLDKNAEFVRSFPLHLGRKAMIHDAAITEKYMIILDFPILFSPEEIFKKNGSLIRSHGDKPSRIGLMPVDAKDESSIQWFEVPSAATFHALNAYDTPEGVVLYLCQMDQVNILQGYEFDSRIRLVRYDINTLKNQVSCRDEPMKLDEIFGCKTNYDFPFVNKSNVGKHAKYAFGTVFAKRVKDEPPANEGIVKYDLETSKIAGTIQFDGRSLGEVVYTLREDAVDEGDGYLSAFIRDPDGNLSLSIFDANSMSSSPIAKIHAQESFHVPLIAFHSQYISEATLGNL